MSLREEFKKETGLSTESVYIKWLEKKVKNTDPTLEALLSCERIRVLGCARHGDKGTKGKIRHIGVEFWTTHSISKSEEDFKEHDTRAQFIEFIEGLKSWK